MAGTDGTTYRDLVRDMLDEFERAKRIQLAMARGAQVERINVASIMLALAMFKKSMELSITTNFGITAEEYAAVEAIADTVAAELLAHSKNMIVQNPHDGTLREFGSIPEAEREIRQIIQNESEVKE